MKRLIAAAAAAVSMTATVHAQAPAAAPPAPPAPPPLIAPALAPVFSVNVATTAGLAPFGAQWRAREAKVVPATPMANAAPGYTASYTLDPRAEAPAFDDSAWTSGVSLSDRTGAGGLSFVWYRTSLTMPAKIGDFDTAGARAVLTVVVDDYAEVWVNGELPRRAGLPSPAAIVGFNMPNRVTLTMAVKPGEKIPVAILAINGPLSVVPQNPIFFREAHIDFYR